MRIFIFFTLLISGCATKSVEVLTPQPDLIRQCYLVANMQIKMAQSYLDGDDYSALHAKYANNAENKQLENFLVGEIKSITEQKPKNAYDYGTSKYSSCVKANGLSVQDENVNMCLTVMLPNELAIKLQLSGKSQDEAMQIVSARFPPDSIQYKVVKSSIEKWYSGSSQSISDFLHSEFNQCMQLVESENVGN